MLAFPVAFDPEIAQQFQLQHAAAAAAAAAQAQAEQQQHQQHSEKKRKQGMNVMNQQGGPIAHSLTLAGVRNALTSEEGILQLIETLKDNGCTVPDQRIAEMLQFIMVNLEIHTRGPSIPSIPKRELCQVLAYVFPNPGDKSVYRPGKSFTAVMKSLMRTIGLPDNVVHGFAGTKRHYKYLSWTAEGQQKVSTALQFTAEGGMPPADLDSDDDDEKKPNPAAVVAAYKSQQMRVRRPYRKQFMPRYDVLFSRSNWCYYIRIMMPMCDPSLIQQGIKLDMYKGNLTLKGRYNVTPTLPPWTTQNEAVGELEVIQPLPPSACGDFLLEIPLPFDVDRTARKEVHVTDIGLIVSLKRLKEDVPQTEFKVHTFAQVASGQPGTTARSVHQ